MTKKQDKPVRTTQFGGTLPEVTVIGSGSHHRLSRKMLVIIIAIILVLLALGLTAYYVIATGVFSPQSKSKDTGINIASGGYTNYNKARDKVDSLVLSGSPESIQQANQIIDNEVTAANQSGNDDYIVDASLEKATLLIQTNHAQDALDTILLPFNKKYSSNDTYKYRIYGLIALAYRTLGDDAKATQYFDLMPVGGGD
jgi:hypothetical protein